MGGFSHDARIENKPNTKILDRLVAKAQERGASSSNDQHASSNFTKLKAAHNRNKTHQTVDSHVEKRFVDAIKISGEKAVTDFTKTAADVSNTFLERVDPQRKIVQKGMDPLS